MLNEILLGPYVCAHRNHMFIYRFGVVRTIIYTMSVLILRSNYEYYYIIVNDAHNRTRSGRLITMRRRS